LKSDSAKTKDRKSVFYNQEPRKFGQYAGGDEIFNYEASENAKVVDPNNLF
jgi:hypothetical protein